jgi:deaminated glutathione amidase
MQKAIFLPEASDYIASNAAESISLAVAVEDSQFVKGLQKAAKDCHISVNVGIHEPTSDRSRVKNTLVWIDEAGELVHRYQKIHLFDVDLKNGPRLKESEYVNKPQALSESTGANTY